MGKITEKIKELFGYFKEGADRFRVTVAFALIVFGLQNLRILIMKNFLLFLRA